MTDQIERMREGLPAMPAVSPATLWRSPNLIPVTGRLHTLGWQDTKKDGPCFLVARTGVMGDKILARFPLTQDGWEQAWTALVALDAGAAQAVAKVLQELQAERAESERQAQLYEAFTAAPPVVLRGLGVQVAADKVYTTGYADAARKTDHSRLLGSLAGAQAVVTDGSQAWSPGRAMFMPIALTGLATKTQADAVVVFADGTTHSVTLDGNNAVREAQVQAVKFNALATTVQPSTPAGDGIAAELERLAALHQSGVLDDEEFRAAKARIIGG